MDAQVKRKIPAIGHNIELLVPVVYAKYALKAKVEKDANEKNSPIRNFAGEDGLLPLRSSTIQIFAKIEARIMINAALGTSTNILVGTVSPITERWISLSINNASELKSCL